MTLQKIDCALRPECCLSDSDPSSYFILHFTKMSFSSLAKIVIRVLNKNKPDDVLILDPDTESETGFNVTFIQPTMSLKTTHWLDYEHVTPYLDSFFRSLRYDTDKTTCTDVQIELPGLPCVMLDKKNLLNYLYEVLDDHLEMLMSEPDSWPVEYTKSECAV